MSVSYDLNHKLLPCGLNPGELRVEAQKWRMMRAPFDQNPHSRLQDGDKLALEHHTLIHFPSGGLSHKCFRMHSKQFN